MTQVLVLVPLKEETKQKLDTLSSYTFTYTQDPSEEQLAQAEVLIGNPTKQQIHKAAHLRWIQTPSAGVDHLKDLPEGITLSNAYGAYGPAIAEYMMTATLMIDYRFNDYQRAQRERNWSNLGYGIGVRNMSILSVGMGSIGTNYLKRMHDLGATCYGITRTKHDKPEFVEEVYTIEALDALLPKMDVVALSLPETQKTLHLFNEQRLKAMKKNSILLNVGRGSAIDENALINVCRDGWFRGVCLDVTEHEPLPKNSPLFILPQVLITPHIAGRFNNPANYDRVMDVIYENLVRASENKELLHTVTTATGGY